MKAIYLETSALLAWLLGEPSAAEVKSRVDAAQTVATSCLTLLEAERALVRAETQGLLNAGQAERLKGLLCRSKAGWVLMEISEEVRARAGRMFPAEPVRTLDAIHGLFMGGIHGIRRTGSAALDLAYVASGRLDGFFEFMLQPWDFAAGRLLIAEAGGATSDCLGAELPLATSTVAAAATPELLRALLAIVGPCVPEPAAGR